MSTFPSWEGLTRVGIKGVQNLDFAVGGAKRSRQQDVGMPAVAHGEIRDFAAKSRFCTPIEYFTSPCQGGRGAKSRKIPMSAFSFNFVNVNRASGFDNEASTIDTGSSAIMIRGFRSNALVIMIRCLGNEEIGHS